MNRIGLLGGTFNPIHIGHLAMAQMALEHLKLNRVIFIPCNVPPHKKVTDLALGRHRYNMIKLAIKGNPHFEVSDFEIKKQGKSYTFETIRHFHKKYKGAQLYFIIGGDAARGLNKWKQIEEILKMVTFTVVNRPGYVYIREEGIHYSTISMPGIEIASSFLRSRVRESQTIKYFVPDSVIRYIKKYNLYG